MMHNKAKTLLQINVACNWGSTGHIAEDIGSAALQLGWRSIIAYGRMSNESQSETYRIDSKAGIAWHGLMTRLFDRQGLESRMATHKLIKKINKWQPDIIHLHNIHGYYINYPILFKFLRSYNHPVVWTLHDCWTFTGHCPHFELAGCFRWRTGCHDCPNSHLYPASCGRDRSAENYRDKKRWLTLPDNITLVPVSNWLASYLAESFMNKFPIHRINNGIDTETFKEQEQARKTIRKTYNLHGLYLVIGVASIWDERKGLNDFIKLRKALTIDFDIMLVGVSKKQISSLPSGIIGIERTNDVYELVSIYSAADVLFNPTMEDTLPTVNLEAQSCGTPVVSYKTGGCPETIVDGQTGFIVQQKDLKTACDKISFICKESKGAFNDTCRHHVVANFRKEDRYKEYMKLYQSLLK